MICIMRIQTSDLVAGANVSELSLESFGVFLKSYWIRSTSVGYLVSVGEEQS